MNLIGVLEGLLFAVGDEGLTIKEAEDILGVSEEEVKELLKNLHQMYEEDNRGIRISYLGDAFKLTTKKEHKEYYQKLLTNERNNLLSDAALETLAIIAYNQPITRVEVDNLRGVNTSQMIRKLVAKGLIKENGKSTMPGRPNLYITTSDFLDYFGLSTISDLPEVEHKEDLTTKEMDLFTSTYKEEND
ncbi:MAG TPA: SMC-Scp complex subunit ScpB [Bacilli bacterium]|nr:SMC-Scp complex subunit ScpB [Bacilli bacterium]